MATRKPRRSERRRGEPRTQRQDRPTCRSPRPTSCAPATSMRDVFGWNVSPASSPAHRSFEDTSGDLAGAFVTTPRRRQRRWRPAVHLRARHRRHRQQDRSGGLRDRAPGLRRRRPLGGELPRPRRQHHRYLAGRPAMTRALLQPHRRHRQHAARRDAAHVAEAARAALRQARGPEPERQRQGPHRQVHDRGGGAHRRPDEGPHRPRADLRQHRHLAGDDLPHQGLPAEGRHPGERQRRAHGAADGVRRRDRLLRRRPRHERLDRSREADRRRRPGVLHAVPVRQRDEPARPLRDDRPGDPARPAGDRRLRRRHGHRRHAHRHRPLPQGDEALA